MAADVTGSVRNIFADLPAFSKEEHFSTLFENDAIRIERIVCHSHPSPPDFWYDQPGCEWVMVLRGGATLEFEGGELIRLKEGDHLTIPRHIKHRVHQTGPDTIWLAVHVRNGTQVLSERRARK